MGRIGKYTVGWGRAHEKWDVRRNIYAISANAKIPMRPPGRPENSRHAGKPVHLFRRGCKWRYKKAAVACRIPVFCHERKNSDVDETQRIVENGVFFFFRSILRVTSENMIISKARISQERIA